MGIGAKIWRGRWGMGESALQSNVEMKESMKGKVTAEGMKLLPARFGGFVDEKRKKL